MCVIMFILEIQLTIELLKITKMNLITNELKALFCHHFYYLKVMGKHKFNNLMFSNPLSYDNDNIMLN